MKKIWIITANRSWADFFEATSNYQSLNHVETINCNEARLPTKDFRSDKQGRIFQPVNTLHHSAGLIHKENQDLLGQFTHNIASYIDKVRVTKSLEGIIIVAAPKVLGMIKKNLTLESKKLIIKTFSKNPSDFNEDIVLSYLRESLKPFLFHTA